MVATSDFAELGRQRPHDPGHDRLQDEAVRPRSRFLADRLKLLLQRLVDRARIQADERFPQIRLLPDRVRHRWPTHGGFARTRRRLDGRTQKEVVDQQQHQHHQGGGGKTRENSERRNLFLTFASA